jgi:hypothetical protein
LTYSEYLVHVLGIGGLLHAFAGSPMQEGSQANALQPV